MSYVSDPAGIGVGENFGPRNIGGTVGKMASGGGPERDLFYHVTAETIDYPTSIDIIEDYYVLTNMLVEVTEAFAANSTVDISLDSGAGLTSPVDLATLGVTDIGAAALAADTTLANVSGTGSIPAALVLDSNATASATGDVRVVLTYKRI